MKKIVRTLKRILTENLLLKLCALIFAFLVWLSVVNVNDPEVTKTISNIPIKMTEEEALTDQKMVYSLVGNDSAQISVTGKRSIISKLTKNDFVARAPLSEMSKVNAVPVYVEIKNVSYQNYVTINQKTKSVKVSVENVETKQYAVDINISGQPFDGYAVGESFVGRNEIDITGPVSKLNLINKVCVNVDVSDATEDVEDRFDISLYKADGTIFDDPQLRFSAKKTKVKVEILMKKRILVNYELKGEPEEGYKITDVQTSVNEIVVWGKKEYVEKCENITIPSDRFVVTGKIKTVTFTEDLNLYLPNGVSVVNSADRNFVVQVNIEKLVEKKYELNRENVTYTNIPTGHEAILLTQKINVYITALQASHDVFDINKVKFIIDLSNAKEGTNSYAVNVLLDDNYEVTNDVTVKVKISKVSDDETESKSETESESETESK